MRLSICMIARNEEENLPRALTSVAGMTVEQGHKAAAPTPMVAALFEYLLQLPGEKLPAGLTVIKGLLQRYGN